MRRHEGCRYTIFTGTAFAFGLLLVFWAATCKARGADPQPVSVAWAWELERARVALEPPVTPVVPDPRVAPAVPAPEPPAVTYREELHVLNGRVVRVLVAVPGSAVVTAAPGVAAGTFRTEPVAAPAVRPAAQRGGTGGGFNPSHRCPGCGYDAYPATYQVRGPGPVPGTHTHSCPKCGASWYH